MPNLLFYSFIEFLIHWFYLSFLEKKIFNMLAPFLIVFGSILMIFEDNF